VLAEELLENMDTTRKESGKNTKNVLLVTQKTLKRQLKNMNEEYCELCGGRIREYYHRITPGLTKSLVKCYEYVSSMGTNLFKMADLKLDHSEYGNFNKLRFHGLIAKHKVNGEIQNREWVITRRGADYLKGNIQIPARVKTYKNRVIDHDEEMVTVTQVMKSEPYWENKFEFDIFKPVQTSLLQ